MKRAIGNLFQNSINHNEQGCKVYVNVTAKNSQCTITVADDGIGATDEQIEKLNKVPHYMVCDENTYLNLRYDTSLYGGCPKWLFFV